VQIVFWKSFINATKIVSTMITDYENLLKRARESMPKEVEMKKRFEMPKAEAFIQGNRTIITNMSSMADYLNRDINHLMKFLLRELATFGSIEGNRAVFTGSFQENKLNEKIALYVKEFVLCRDCGKPDTKLVKEDNHDYIKCMACQAKRPVTTLK
jgi:translation initiation factor 2 subunit 2